MLRIIVTLVLFFHIDLCSARIHYLRLENEERPIIHISQFGFFRGGILEVHINALTLQQSTIDKNNNLIGFTVDKTLTDGITPYPHTIDDSNCALRLDKDSLDADGVNRIGLAFDLKANIVNVGCSHTMSQVRLYSNVSDIPFQNLVSSKGRLHAMSNRAPLNRKKRETEQPVKAPLPEAAPLQKSPATNPPAQSQPDQQSTATNPPAKSVPMQQSPATNPPAQSPSAQQSPGGNPPAQPPKEGGKSTTAPAAPRISDDLPAPPSTPTPKPSTESLAARTLKLQRKKRRAQRRAQFLGLSSPEEAAAPGHTPSDTTNSVDQVKEHTSVERAQSQIALLRVGVILAMSGCVLMGVGFLLKPAYASFEVGLIAMLFGVYVLIACGCQHKANSQRDLEGQVESTTPRFYSLLASKDNCGIADSEIRGVCNLGLDTSSEEVVIQNELSRLRKDSKLIGIGYMIPTRIIAKPIFEQIPEESEPETASLGSSNSSSSSLTRSQGTLQGKTLGGVGTPPNL